MAEDPGATARTVTARKAFDCEGYRCPLRIQVGEDYARLVAFPGHDANTEGTRPRVLRICQRCYTEHGKAMPPRKTKTGVASC